MLLFQQHFAGVLDLLLVENDILTSKISSKRGCSNHIQNWSTMMYLSQLTLSYPRSPQGNWFEEVVSTAQNTGVPAIKLLSWCTVQKYRHNMRKGLTWRFFWDECDIISYIISQEKGHYSIGLVELQKQSTCICIVVLESDGPYHTLKIFGWAQTYTAHQPDSSQKPHSSHYRINFNMILS